MNNQNKEINESILLELLDRWELAWENGDAISPEDLCAEHPELLDQVRFKVEALKAIDQHLQEQTLPVRQTDSENSFEHPYQTVSQFTDFQFLAEGGLGKVFSATEPSMNREVAVKFIQQRLIFDPVSRRQFDLEARITGRLEHPGIVPLYGVGQTAQGKPFYVMRLIQGETLDSRIEKLHAQGVATIEDFASVEFRDLLQHFVTICNTIAYAHNRGILHRDIKPANVMLGRYGETLVVDWGLAIPISRDQKAKASGELTLMSIEESGEANSSGGGAGTLAYMSPEQSVGDVPLAPTSDVYSLGAVLYKIITGRPPIAGESMQSLLAKVRQGEFLPPKELKRQAPAGLQAICLKAMALEPKDRYETALQLADDVQRFLADEPVSVQRDSLLQQLGRWCRRHRGAALSFSIASLALIILLGVTAIGFQRLAHTEHQLLMASQSAEARSLQMAARFAAQTVAAEIDIRWRILETEAVDGELVSLLSKDDQPLDEVQRRRLIQAWLDGRFLHHNQTIGYTSWLICDQQGNQIARSPRADTIGKNFSHRDYFHGILDSIPDNPQPLRGVHLSQVFVSAVEKTDMVAFSVPIWNGNVDSLDRKVIGVLAMTVVAGEFGVLESGLQGDQVSMLIDTRNDMIDGQPQTGRILHHPRLSDLDAEESHPRRLPEEKVEKLSKYAQLRTSSDEDLAIPMELFELRDFLGDSARAMTRAAVQPVVVRGRHGAASDTGWLVVVKSPLKD